MELLDVETAQERIQTILEALTGGVVTGWSAIYEVVLPTGDKMLQLALSPDARTWNVKGWLLEALDDLRNVS